MNNNAFSNTISRYFGAFASKEHSPNIQKFINKSYVSLMGLNMQEFEPSDNYPTLNALFTRKLTSMRPFDTHTKTFISPVDAFITAIGTIEEQTALQIKGMDYRISELFGPNIDASPYIDGGYINFYLSPKDYHRYHSPCDLSVKRVAYIPGPLYPVNERALKSVNSLFCKNERVVMEGTTPQGKKVILVFVGALNVGKMVLHIEPRVNTNALNGYALYTYPEEIKIQKGEELGMFMMGSTVVAFFEPQTFIPHIKENISVRFGQTIGEWA